MLDERDIKQRMGLPDDFRFDDNLLSAIDFWFDDSIIEDDFVYKEKIVTEFFEEELEL